MSEMAERHRDELVGLAEESTRGWWLHLVVGIAWMVFAFIVLSFEFETVWAVAAFFGIGFLFGGVTQLVLASTMRDWRWLHVLFGLAAVGAGIVALVWPGATFLVLAAIIAWYVLLAGIFDILAAFATRDESDLWWLQLVLGIAQILIGFWAIGYAGRSIVLLVVWVGAAALARGISQLVFGFSLHRAGRQLRRRLSAGG